MPPTEKLFESLPCKLTDAERASRSQALAAAVRELGDPAVKIKALVDAAKQKVADELTAVRNLATVVATGEEHRDVEVRVAWDWTDKTVRTYRLDTDKLVNSRAMTKEEQAAKAQEVLPFAGAVVATPVKYAGETTEDDTGMPPRVDA